MHKYVSVVGIFLLLSACSTTRAQVPPEIESLTDETWETDVVASGSTDTGDWYVQYGEFLGGVVDGTGYVGNDSLDCPWFSTTDLAETADSVLAGLAPYDSQSLWIRRSECIQSFRSVLEDSLGQSRLGTSALPAIEPQSVSSPFLRLTDYDAMREKPVYMEVEE